MKIQIIIVVLATFFIGCKSTEVKKLEKASENYSQVNSSGFGKGDNQKLTDALFYANSCREIKANREKIEKEYEFFCSQEKLAKILAEVTDLKVKYSSKKIPDVFIIPMRYAYFDENKNQFRPIEGLKPHRVGGNIHKPGRLFGFYVCGQVFNFSDAEIKAIKATAVPVDPFGKLLGGIEIVKKFEIPISKYETGLKYVEQFEYIKNDETNILCSDKYFSDIGPDSVGEVKIIATEVR